jgi:pyrimidine-specific ribonucleoside hydrolase
MIDLAFDMETSDPDDVMTLCMLAHHPQVNLKGVTVTPGSRHQIGLVKHILKLLGKDIPVGAKNINHPKECVSEFHYSWLGQIPPADADGNGPDVLWQAHYGTVHGFKIICGASLGNLYAYSQRYVLIPEAVIQGGFAGDNVMPPELVLPKFKGKTTCPTFNLNGDVPAALGVLASDKILRRTFVSKNVCHGVVYDSAMHEYMQPYKNNNPGLSLMIDGMDHYLKRHPSGKAFHDPLAAAVAIDPSVCQFADVELYRHKGEWGSKESDKPNARISISVDMDKFRKVIVGV